MEYKVTDTELISVANAIRTKTETTDDLSFPNGFVSGINSIDIDTSTSITVNVIEGGTNADKLIDNIAAYGAAINGNELIIYAISSSNLYEHISFITTTYIGNKGYGWDITNFASSDPVNVPYACTINLNENYNSIDVKLKLVAASGNNDYLQLEAIITGE